MFMINILIKFILKKNKKNKKKIKKLTLKLI